MKIKLCNMLISLFFLIIMSGCHRGYTLQGYIEGRYTYISSSVSGTLIDLGVWRGQQVQQGQFLYRLDPEPELSSVKAAEANIQDLQAQILFFKAQLERQQRLYQKNVAGKVDLDRAQKDFDSTYQQLLASQATLARMQWALHEKTIYAAVSGQVFDTFYQKGESVSSDHPVLAILEPRHIEVLFYVPESLLSDVKLGKKISFSCDGCVTTQAKINYISPEAEYTPPVIYSKDTRYKLVYLVRAAMLTDVAKNFHPGQPIDVYLPS